MRKLLLIFILLAAFVPVVYAFETSYSVMPGSGSYTETILITVRVDPIIDEKPMWVSIFWDKRLVESLVPSPIYGKTQYQHRWDITITPPPNHAEEGKHKIEIWIETQDGGITVLPWQYTITDGLPQFSVWDEFLEEHPEILTQLVGPKGDTGNSGVTGAKGAKGSVGDPGQDGETGATGPQGIIGLSGLKGDTGEAGSNVSYLFVFFLASVVIGFTWFRTRKLRKDVTALEAKLRINDQNE